MALILFICSMVVGASVVARFETEKLQSSAELWSSWCLVLGAIGFVCTGLIYIQGWFGLVGAFVLLKAAFLGFHFRELGRAYRRHPFTSIRTNLFVAIFTTMGLLSLIDSYIAGVCVIWLLCIMPARALRADGITVKEYVNI